MIDSPLTLFNGEEAPKKKRGGLKTVVKTSEKIATKIAEVRKSIKWPTNYYVIKDVSGLGKLAREISNAKAFGWDTETSGLEPFDGDKAYCVSFWVNDQGYLVNFDHPLLPQIDRATFASLIGPYFNDPTIKQYTFNHAFDRDFLETDLDIRTGPVYIDGGEAMWVIDENWMGGPKNNRKLKPMCEHFLGIPGDPYEEMVGKTAWIVVDPLVASWYAIGDAEKHWKLGQWADNELAKEPELFKLYHELEQPCGEVYYQSHLRGIEVDIKYLREELAPAIAAEITDIRDNMEALVSWQNIEWEKPDVVGALLFDTLKLPKIKGYSTDKTVLEELSDKHKLIPLLLKYRQLTKLESAFIKPLLNKGAKGRVHAGFRVTGAATGRSSSSNPNVHQMPSKEDAGGDKVRKAFLAPEGYRFVSKDFDSQELRIQAGLSKDQLLISILEKGEKVYAWAAAIFWGGLATDYKKSGSTKPKYDKGKQAVLALTYGAQESKLGQIFECPNPRARQFIKDFYQRFSGLGRYQQTQISSAKKRGYVKTVLGRRRRLDFHGNLNRGESNALERLAINAPIQGSAADQTKLAVVLCDRHFRRRGYKSYVVMSIHDEIVFAIHEDEFLNTTILQEIDLIMTTCIPQFGITFATTTEVYARQWGVKDETLVNEAADESAVRT